MSSTEILNFLFDVYRENNITLNNLRTPINNTTSMGNTQQVSECLMDINAYIVNSAVRLLTEQSFPQQSQSTRNLNNFNIRNIRQTQNQNEHQTSHQHQTTNINQNQTISQTQTQPQTPVFNNNYLTTNRYTPYYLYDIISEYTIPFRQTTNTNTTTNNTVDPLISTLLRSFMDPIPSRNEGLNEQEILTATRYCTYGNIVNPRNTSCPISLDTFQDSMPVCVIRGCGHIFKQTSIYAWLRTNNRCPVCRYDVSTYQTNTQTSSEPNNNENQDISDIEERSETDSVS